MNNDKIKISTRNLNVYYGAKQALFNINLDLMEKKVTALIGPSGCGKSTFIRCLNRMNDVIDICKVDGSIKVDGSEINEKAEYKEGFKVPDSIRQRFKRKRDK